MIRIHINIKHSSSNAMHSFIERMLSEVDGEHAAKKTGNKSSAPIDAVAAVRIGQKVAPTTYTNSVGAEKDEGFSFDWLDGSSDDSIDQTLDELLNQPMRSEQSSTDGLQVQRLVTSAQCS